MAQEVISIKVLNEILGQNKYKYFVNETKGHTGVSESDYEGKQGEYNETFRFYKHSEFPEGVFMRETIHTDSYGDGETIQSLQFVKGKEKMITVFEPI